MSDIIKSLGLTIIESQDFVPGSKVIAVSELKFKLDKLPVVYGQKNIGGGMTYSDQQGPCDTHSAKLLGVERIVKGPFKKTYGAYIDKQGQLVMPAEFTHGIRPKDMRVEVVVTEIQEDNL